MSFLKIQNVKKVYSDGSEALKEIDFSVEKGEFISIIGPSGAGKTSLIRMINGSIKTNSGDILLDGKSIVKSKKSEKKNLQKRIGTIYQDFCLVDNLSCIQNVLNGCLAQRNACQALLGVFTKDQKEYAYELLKIVGIEEKADTMASQISGGQKQRVAIARALMQKPDIILADEPVASLDPYTSNQIINLLRELQQNMGLTVIMNSHNVELALDYSDRIIGIKDGKLVLDKSAEAITKEMIADVYEL